MQMQMVKQKDANANGQAKRWQNLERAKSVETSRFLTYSAKTVVSWPVIKFGFEFLRDAEFFMEYGRILWRTFYDPIICEQGKKDYLSRDKQDNPVSA